MVKHEEADFPEDSAAEEEVKELTVTEVQEEA